MQIKRSGSQIFGANLTAAEKKAMNMEIQRQLSEYDRNNANEIAASVLWILHSEFGFGKNRLERFREVFIPTIEALCERYELTDEGDDIWLCMHKLKELGITFD